MDLGGRVLTGTRFGDRWAVLATGDDDPDRIGAGEFIAHLTTWNLVRLGSSSPSLHPMASASTPGSMAEFMYSTFRGFDPPMTPMEISSARSTPGRPRAFVNEMDPTTGLLAIEFEGSGVTLAWPENFELVEIPGNDTVAHPGLARSGELLLITRFDGSIRAWDIDANLPPGWFSRAAAPDCHRQRTTTQILTACGLLVRSDSGDSAQPGRVGGAGLRHRRSRTDRQRMGTLRSRDDPPTPACS